MASRYANEATSMNSQQYDILNKTWTMNTGNGMPLWMGKSCMTSFIDEELQTSKDYWDRESGFPRDKPVVDFPIPSIQP